MLAYSVKRLGRDFNNFGHFRNHFLYTTKSNPVLNVLTDYNPVTYYADDEFNFVFSNDKKFILRNYYELTRYKL